MNRKVKILYLVTESEWAGASRYVYDLATHLPAQEFDIVVAATGKGDVLMALEKHGVKTVRLRWLPRSIHPLKDLLAFWEILFLYFKEKPNTIHLNSSKAGFIGSIAAIVYKLLQTTNYKLQTIYTAHGWVFNEPGRANWFFRWLERFASYFRDTIICVSENDRREALRFGIAPEKRLVTIHNGVDPAAMEFLERGEARVRLSQQGAGSRDKTASFGAVRRSERDGGREQGLEIKFLGCVANLYPNKGIEHLIEAIHLFQIHAARYMLHAAIIGNGPLRSQLEAQIKKYGLEDRVFLVGQIPEAWQYVKAFDCFVLPSIKEGLPYAILEALAAGVPVVATNVGGIPEIAKETSIRLVPPENPQALAEAIIETLERKPSDEEKFPSEFTLQTMVKKTLEVYRIPAL